MNEPLPVFHIHDEPAEIPFDIGMLQHFRILMGGATADRANPTLTVVGLWENEWAYRHAIIVLYLSPSMQRMTLVGTASLDDGVTFTLNYESLFPLMGKACPSILLSPLLLPPSRALWVYHQFFMTLDHGFRLLEGIRKNPRDPFRRMGRMFNSGEACEDRRLEDDEALELATHLLKPRITDLEWKAFILAWDEAATARTKSNPAGPVLDLKALISIYDVLQSTCRLKWRRVVKKPSRVGSPRKGA